MPNNNNELGLKILQLDHNIQQSKEEAKALRKTREHQSLLADKQDKRAQESHDLQFKAQQDAFAAKQANEVPMILNSGEGFVGDDNPNLGALLPQLMALQQPQPINGPDGKPTTGPDGNPQMTLPSIMTKVPNGLLFTRPGTKQHEEALRVGRLVEQSRFESANNTLRLQKGVLDNDLMKSEIEKARRSPYSSSAVNAAKDISFKFKGAVDAEMEELVKQKAAFDLMPNKIQNPDGTVTDKSLEISARMLELERDPFSARAIASKGMDAAVIQNAQRVLAATFMGDPSVSGGNMADYSDSDKIIGAAMKHYGSTYVRPSTSGPTAPPHAPAAAPAPSPEAIRSRKTEILKRLRAGNITPADRDEALLLIGGK